MGELPIVSAIGVGMMVILCLYISFLASGVELPNSIELGDTPRGGARRHSCGSAFGPLTTQEELYESMLAPLVEHALEPGFDAIARSRSDHVIA